MRIFYALTTILLIIGLLPVAVGCSGDACTMTPPIDSRPALALNGSHTLLGLWQMTADPDAGTLDIVPMRTGEMHLNALPFLEPPPLLYLTLESLQFNGDIIEADIGLRHPFLGLIEFTGFDVTGVLISNGSITGFDNPGLLMAGKNDTYLMNPDGLTRWWNPAEFPRDGTIFGYKDGLLGTPDSFADFNSTLNGYKLFCDDLTGTDIPLTTLDPSNRCMFSPGEKNIRHYTIKLGTEGLVFNYAVDASWQFPLGDPPWEAPDDFPEGANRVEAWLVSVTELENTLFNYGDTSGGGLSLLIDVWDHYNADMNTIVVESPGNFTFASSSTPVGGGEGYSTYQVNITEATPAEGSIDILISVESEAEGYQDMLGGETVTAYFLHTAEVDTPLENSCDFGATGFSLAGTWHTPDSWAYLGVKVTHQDPIQRIILLSYPSNDTVNIHNADNPDGPPVASYNTGDVILSNNYRPFWVDPVSESGIDRIIYNNLGTGHLSDGYQLRTIDWDGTQFSNPQTLPKHSSLWSLCVTPEGDLISHDAYAWAPVFFLRDKSDDYALSELFALQQSTCPFGIVSNIRDIAYNWMLDAVILFCRNIEVSDGGQLFVLDMAGNLLFEDLDIFGGNEIDENVAVDIDFNDPSCHVVVYAGDNTQYGHFWIGRYSWDFNEKSINEYSEQMYGPANGELCADGTLWTVWNDGRGVHKFDPPPDW